MTKRKPARNDQVLARLFPATTQRGDRTKINMVEAGIDVLAELGLEGLTFDSIGHRVGMNRAQVRYHFPSTEGITAKCIELTLSLMQEFVLGEMEKANGWREQLEALGASLLDWCQKYPRYAKVLLLFYTVSTRDEKYGDLLKALAKVSRERMRALLGELARERQWSRQELDNRCDLAWALIEGFAVHRIMGYSRPSTSPDLLVIGLKRLLET